MKVTLIRHATTLSNMSNTYMGSLDAPATPEGLYEAEKLGALVGLDPSEAFYSSPLSRARETLTAMKPRGPVRIDARLAERNLGMWEGMNKDLVRRTFPEAFLATGAFDATFTPPQGESLEEFSARVAGFLNEVCAEEPRDIVIVTHNGWIRTARYLLGEISLPEIFSVDEPHLEPLGLRMKPILGTRHLSKHA